MTRVQRVPSFFGLGCPQTSVPQFDRTMLRRCSKLKTIQEVTTLAVFCVFSVLYLREPLKWNYVLGFSMMAGAVFVIFKEW
jgi:uncharacterized protein (DUF486 family)